jgi:2-desacetyl-2-hydroxyethyl bacteriochlorophyllide A dehydrogenase
MMSESSTPKIPAHMNALRIREFGGPEVLEWEEVPTPEIAPDELLIRVAFCGVCRHDLLTRAGAFPSISLPVIPGHQVSGYVAAVGGEVNGFRPGQRVMTTIYMGCGRCQNCRAGNQALCLDERPRFLGEDIDGGYAEYVRVRQDAALPVPEGVSLKKAAVITCTLGTAYHSIVTQAKASSGETLLITGASGGVGMHAVKIAKHLGARVIAVTSSPGKRPVLESVGADEVLIAPDLQFRSEVKSLTDGRGADVVIETVGAPTLNESIRAVRNGGRIVVLGNVEGKPVEIRPAHFILKEIHLSGTKSCTLPELDTVLSLVADGRLDVEIGECVPLKRAAEAHRRMEDGSLRGRLILEVGGET